MTQRYYSQVFGVVAAIIEKEGKYLLVKESGLKRVSSGKWNHPAGWIDVGENPLSAVAREVLEETGYSFTPTRVIGLYSLYCSHMDDDATERIGGVPHAIKILYTGTIDDSSQSALAGDTSEIGWFTKAEILALPNLRDPDIPRIIEDFERGQQFPLEIVAHTGEVKKTV